MNSPTQSTNLEKVESATRSILWLQYIEKKVLQNKNGVPFPSGDFGLTPSLLDTLLGGEIT